MKSTKHFLAATPAVRTDMVLRGYEHISAKMRLLAVEMGILNEWVKLMPDLIGQNNASRPDVDDNFENITEEYKAAADNVTAIMVDNAIRLKQLQTAINFYKKYDNAI